MSDKTNGTNRAWLATSTGLILEGRACGAKGTAKGELVFNTSMAGYLEIITHPGAHGQVLTFTMPEIGNYGVNSNDVTDASMKPAAVVARIICDEPSNWSSECSLPDYLTNNEIVAIDQVDTRKLTRHVRDNGPVGAVVTTEEMTEEELINAAKMAAITPALIEAEEIARDLGATLTKLPLGHHASNIPVKDLRTGKLYITRQHHGYSIDFSDVEGVEITHINLNDQTVEGFTVPAKGIEATLFDSLELRDLLTADQIQKEG
ncbi:MAG: hypothetical protein FWE48_07310 [Coriobacteriia bacterium]|nr:hypothetical protein [Coriobacteriia bacterium]MCL2746874.1 hypothetical protein [Coriobacteriia bacterium]MCL2870720.1 hypothetical protein [Coriobacteriia bacterium]